MNLTEEQILNLEGRELDEAVAEHIVGEPKPEEEPSSKDSFSRLVDSIKEDDRWPTWWTASEDPGGPIRWWCKQFSSQIEAAYEAEEMVPEGERQNLAESLFSICQLSAKDWWSPIHATPTQRCRALLLWKLRRQDSEKQGA